LSAEHKVKLLKSVLGNFSKVGEERLFYCPKCNHHKPKLSVNLEKDNFKCWICDYKSTSIYRLIRRYGNFSQRKQWEEITGKLDLSAVNQDLISLIRSIDSQEEVVEQVITLPEEFRTLTGKDHHISAIKPKRYLSSRGISGEDVLKWKIGYCSTGEYEGRIIIPSFNMDGRVNYFIARTYEDSWIKYKNPPAQRDVVFNELYVDWENDLTLVEGVFDALIADNAIPLLGSSLRENSKLFSKIVKHDTPIYVALDPDAESKSMRLIKNLIQYGCEVYKVDVGGFDDVGSMSKQVFNERKENAIPMDLDTAFLYQALSAV
jgi:DNA primase